MPDSDPLVANPSLALAVGDDGYLGYNLQTAELHRLNATASLIVELSDGSRDRDSIARELAALTDDAGRAACAEWIDRALRDGLLIHASAVAMPVLEAGTFADAASELRASGDVLAAYVCQEHAVILDPDEADYWSALGELAHITGRRARAREAYEQYLSLASGDAEVEQILVALRDEPPPPRAPDRCIEQLYRRFAARYESNMCGDLDYKAPARIREALDAHAPGGALDVLELGTGTGLAAPILRPRARTLTGIDLSPEMLEQARATSAYDELIVAEITGWLTDNRRVFDLIAACDTLIYFGDLRQVLAPASRALNPGGAFAFTVERLAGMDGFVLTDSGRYAHSATHVRDAAHAACLSVVSLTEGFLRHEYGEPVTGLIVVLRK